jgi:segregation and condensation protein A
MEKEGNKINHEQFYDLITGEEVSWQAIIYDLIKTEQLDPWDINLAVLAEKYMEIIQQLEEANFFVSSKVLLACALLLRLKSEILNNDYIKNLDEAMYGKKEEKKHILERIELEEGELPILVPRTPMPRFKKVTLKELMSALNKAIETEGRRIRKDIRSKQAEKAISSVFPKETRVPLKSRILEIMGLIKKHFKELEKKEVTFHELAPTRKEKLENFLPLLHLDTHEKLFVRQNNPFEEIFIKLEKHNIIEELEVEEEIIEDLSKGEILEGDKLEQEELNEQDIS